MDNKNEKNNKLISIDVKPKLKMDVDINQIFKADLERISLQQSQRLQEFNKRLKQSVTDRILIQNQIMKYHPTQHIDKFTLPSLKVMSSYLNTRMFEPLQHFQSQMQSIVRPIVEYAEKNKYKLENFEESSDRLIAQLSKQHDIGEDDAISLIDDLIEEGKIIVTEDWTVVLIEDSKEGATFKPTLSDIINLISIIITLISMTSNSDQVDIDNYVTNIENQIIGDVYHINEIAEINNEYIIVNKTQLFEDNDVDSEIVAELTSGDKVNKIIVEDELMLVAILDDDNTIKYTGWIMNKDVTLID